MKIRGCIFCLIMLMPPAIVNAAGMVSGRYGSAGGRNIVIVVEVSKPPPAAYIVLQRIPPRITVSRADPAPAGFIAKTGTLKWFIKNPRPGERTFTLNLSAAVPARALSGEIRYRDPVTGRMVRRTIARR